MFWYYNLFKSFILKSILYSYILSIGFSFFSNFSTLGNYRLRIYTNSGLSIQNYDISYNVGSYIIPVLYSSFYIATAHLEEKSENNAYVKDSIANSNLPQYANEIP